MKRIIIFLMLVALLLTGAMSVYATDAEVTVQVRASQTEVSVGDTVEFTVLVTGTGVVAMQFNLQLPEGLAYVPNSAATPENLAQKLGVPAADWTEQSMMFTFYNDVGITFAKGTEILRFSCVAQKAGDWVVDLYELLPFDENFEEFVPTLQTQKITVYSENSPENGTSPMDPDETPAVTPSETKPSDTVTEPDKTPVDDTDLGTDSVTTGTVIDPTVEENDNTDTNETVPVKGEKPALKNKTKAEGIQPGVILVAIAALIGIGIFVFILIKKKKV